MLYVPNKTHTLIHWLNRHTHTSTHTHAHTQYTLHIVTLEISCYSIYKRWHQLYTAYNGEEQLQSPLDTDGFANLEASLPNSYVMDAMDELRVII